MKRILIEYGQNIKKLEKKKKKKKREEKLTKDRNCCTFVRIFSIICFFVFTLKKGEMCVEIIFF